MLNTPTKHTPGPWAFTMQEEYGKPQFNAVMTGDNSALADVKFAFLMHPAECHANAQLIAAAPDLLDAAELALEGLERMDAANLPLSEFERGNIAILSAAIAKAKGVQSTETPSSFEALIAEQQEIQKRNPFGSPEHRAADERIRALVKQFKGTDIGEYL